MVLQMLIFVSHKLRQCVDEDDVNRSHGQSAVILGSVKARNVVLDGLLKKSCLFSEQINTTNTFFLCSCSLVGDYARRCP